MHKSKHHKKLKKNEKKLVKHHSLHALFVVMIFAALFSTLFFIDGSQTGFISFDTSSSEIQQGSLLAGNVEFKATINESELSTLKITVSFDNQTAELMPDSEDANMSYEIIFDDSDNTSRAIVTISTDISSANIYADETGTYDLVVALMSSEIAVQKYMSSVNVIGSAQSDDAENVSDAEITIKDDLYATVDGTSNDSIEPILNITDENLTENLEKDKDDKSKASDNNDSAKTNGNSVEVTVSETIEDSKRNKIDAVIEISDNATTYDSNGKSHSIKVAPGNYTIKVKPNNHKIKEIDFNDVQINNDVKEIVDIDEITGKYTEYVKVYAINPKYTNFTTATVTSVAEGTALYKCADWDFDNQNCNGEWVLIKTGLVPGEEYSFTMTQLDPAFGESGDNYTVDLVILNATSAYNTTADNLTLQWKINYSGSAKNITNWYRNGTSLTVLNMPFEGGSNASFTKDYSGFGNNGTQTTAANQPTWSSTGGYDGKGAYSFDGGDYIKLGSGSTLYPTKAVSVEAWVKNNGDTSSLYVSSWWGSGFRGYNLYSAYTYGTKATFSVGCAADNTKAARSTTNVTDNKWHHLVGVYNGTHALIYVDGNLENTTATPLCTALDYSGNGCSQVTIGSACGGTAYYTTGSMDDVRIWNISLSSEQIKALYYNRTDLIVAQETTLGETWQACVTPNNGTIDGATNCTNTLAILNGPPTIDSISLNATSTYNKTADNLTLYYTSSDVDGDSVKNITNWYRNGTSIAVLNMPFEGGSNSTWTKDYSGYGRDATQPTAANQPVWNSTGGYDGKGAYVFDGVNDYINGSAASITSLTDDITITAWMKIVESGERITIMANEPCNWVFSSYENARLYFTMCDSGAAYHKTVWTGTDTLPYYQWNHVAVVYNYSGSDTLNNIKFYINGQSVSHTQLAWDAGLRNDATTLAIGYRGIYSSQPFNGSIDDVVIYSSALSAEQILALYNNRTDLIVAQETTLGETWKACVTPNDGLQDGTQNCSNNLTISENTAPAINFVGPTLNSGTTITYNYIPVNVTATDTESGLKNITIYLYNSTAQLYANTSTTSPNFKNYTGLADGTYYFNATAYDNSNNLNLTETRNVTIDTTTPAVDFAANADASGSIVGRLYIIVNTTAFDATSGLKNITTHLYNSVGSLVNSANSATSPLYVNFSSLTKGLYYFNSTAYDNALNSNSTSTRNVTVNSVPAVNSISLNVTSANNLTADNLTLHYTTSDGDNDAVKNITNWYRDGTSIAVLNMPFEGGSNSTWTKDYSNNGLNGTITTAIWNSTDGYDGFGSYQFNGDDYITLPSTTVLDIGTGNFTLNTWFKTSDGSAYRYIYAKGGGGPNYPSLSLRLTDTGKIQAYAVDCTTGSCGFGTTRHPITTTNSYADGKWHMATFARNGSTVRLYVDSQLEESLSEGPWDVNGNEVGLIGVIGGGGGYYWNGSIDELVFYNYSLSAEQILALYNNRTNLIVAQETSIGETWKGCVTPNDGTTDGTESCSNNVTILNAVPAVDSVSLNATLTSNTSNDNLTLHYTTSDGDNDAVKNITNWYKDGTSIAVLNMPFEGRSNSTWTKDYSGTKNGTVLNAIWSSTGGHDGKGAYIFDGNGDYIDVGNATSIKPKNITISAWVKRAATGARHTIFSNGDHMTGSFTEDGFWMAIESNDALRLDVGDGSGSVSSLTTKTIADTNWHHVVATHSGSTTKLYIDGQVNLTQTTKVAAYTKADNALIGKAIGGTGYFNGNIDDVQVFDQALSAEQVLTLYNNRTDLIVAQETSVGDVWKGCVTPNDGTTDGTESCSNNLTILNAAPAVNSISLNATSTSNTSNDNLTLYYTTSDLDGNGIKNITNWYRNGTSIAVLNMPFEGGSNSTWTKDYSSYGYNGTVSGPTWNSTGGKDGLGAYKFSGGTSNYMTHGLSRTNSQATTISLWFKETADNAQATGIMQIGQMGFELANHWGAGSQMLFFFVKTGAGSTNGYLAGISDYTGDYLNEWHHLTGVWNGTIASIYLDGNLIATDDHADPSWGGDANYIGRSYEYSYSPNGFIDDIMIFDRALSIDQIKALYNNRTDLIVQQETSTGDIWKGCVTPNDGTVDGTESCSNNLTIEEIPAVIVPIASKTPADIDSLNLLNTYANLTYNATSNVGQLNTSSVTLYYKANSSASDCWTFVNGSLQDCGYSERQYSSSSSDLYSFLLYDNHIYPGTFNFNERSLETTPHESYLIDNSSKYVKIRLFNVSNSKQYSYFEVFANATSTANPLQIYYCNSSYIAQNPTTSSYCTHVYDLLSTTPFNHNHSEYSSHHVIPIAINATSGKLNNVSVTDTSYFLLRGTDTIGWDVRYVSNLSRADSIQNATITTTTRVPNAAGSATTLTRTCTPTCAANFEAVDETTSDGDTTYVYGPATSLTNDLYNAGDMPISSGYVNKVTVYVNARAEATCGGLCQAQTVLRTNGVTYTGTANTLAGTAYTLYSTEYTVNPQTGQAWTISEVNNMEIGVGLKSRANTNNRRARATQVYAVVDYADLTNFSGTVDAHLHQYDGTEKVYYYACANDTLGNGNCSSEAYDLLDLAGIAPNAPVISSPVTGYYADSLLIEYSESVSPNGYAITHYNISLVNSTHGFVQSIQSNNSLNLSYTWDTNLASDGAYRVRVEACDNMSQCSYGYSYLFTIDNTLPIVDYTTPTEDPGEILHTLDILVNVTSTDTNPDIVYIYLYNSSGDLIMVDAGASPNYASFTAETKGQYYFNATAYDLAGNTNYTSTRNVTINQLPLVDSISLNATNADNNTNENLTLHYTVSDADNETVRNITNWYKNGTSIAVLNMPFEGGSNSTFTKDYSSYGYNGTVTNAIWNSTGGYDGKGAYQFDGSGDSIDAGSSAIFNFGSKPFTVTGWAKFNILGTDLSLVGKGRPASGNGWWVFKQSNDKLWLCYNDQGSGNECGYGNEVQSVSAVSTGIWYHFAAVRYANGSKAMYLNGVGSFSSTNAGAIVSSSDNLKIGIYGDNSYGSQNGSIDDVMIFNYSLSAEQITALYNNRTDVIVMQETTSGEIWKGCVTPNDGIADGTVSCSNNITITSAYPIVQYFTGATTNFTAYSEEQLVSLPNVTIESPTYGLVKWNNPIDVSAADFNSNVIIAENYIEIKAENLDPTINSSVNVTFYNITFVAPAIEVNKTGAWERCYDCTVYGLVNNTLLFDVPHFTAYQSVEGSNLTIWDETDTSMPYADKIRYTDDNTYFFANYTNATGPLNSSDTYCGIRFYIDGSWTSYVNMTFNTTNLIYQYNRSFNVSNTYDWNVLCNATSLGFNYLNATDNVTISTRPGISITNDVPSTNFVKDQWNEYTVNVTCTSGNCADINVSLDPEFSTKIEADFNEGTYDNTFYNSSFVQLNDSQTSGNYLSKIFYNVLIATWESIAWTENLPYMDELLDDNANETALGGIDMTRNILLLHLNEAAGTLYDTSSSRNNATASGGVTYNQTGKFNKALRFDGVDGLVNTTEPLDTGLLSMQLWFKPSQDYDSNTGKVVLAYDTDFELYIQNGTMWFNFSGFTSKSTTSSFAKDTWYSIMAVYDGTVEKIYINGVLENTTTIESKVVLQNNAGENIAAFYESGTLVLKGVCFNGACVPPTDDALIIQDPLGDTVAFINGTGSMCLKNGNCKGNHDNCDDFGDGAFVVMNDVNGVIAHINATGYLCAKGELIENGNP